MSTFTPSTLYYASALINLLTIPKHFLVGQQHVSKAVDAIPSTPEHARGKSIAFTTWEYAMGALFVSGTSIMHPFAKFHLTILIVLVLHIERQGQIRRYKNEIY